MSPRLNLLAQFFITVILLTAVLYAKRRNFRLHGLAMTAAVTLNALSIILVMMPSARRIFEGASINGFTVTVGIHIVLGTLAELAGVYIVWRWRLREPGSSCFRLGGRMRGLNLLWLVMAILGAAVYYMLYF